MVPPVTEASIWPLRNSPVLNSYLREKGKSFRQLASLVVSRIFVLNSLDLAHRNSRHSRLIGTKIGTRSILYPREVLKSVLYS